MIQNCPDAFIDTKRGPFHSQAFNRLCGAQRTLGMSFRLLPSLHHSLTYSFVRSFIHSPPVLYRLLNTIVPQPTNCPFGVNTTPKLRIITTPDNTAIWYRTLSNVVTFFSSIVVLTQMSICGLCHCCIQLAI